MVDFFLMFKKKPAPQMKGSSMLIQEPETQVIAMLDYDGIVHLKVQSRAAYKRQPDGSLVYAVTEREISPGDDNLVQTLDAYLTRHGPGVAQDATMAAYQALVVSSSKGEV